LEVGGAAAEVSGGQVVVEVVELMVSVCRGPDLEEEVGITRGNTTVVCGSAGGGGEAARER